MVGVAILFWLVIISIFIARGLVIVKRDRSLVVIQLGKYSRMLHPGLHMTVPFLEKVIPLEELLAAEALVRSPIAPNAAGEVHALGIEWKALSTVPLKAGTVCVVEKLDEYDGTLFVRTK